MKPKIWKELSDEQKKIVKEGYGEGDPTQFIYFFAFPNNERFIYRQLAAHKKPLQKFVIKFDPDLLKKIGYDFDCSLVGIWWEPAGDELAWSDGRVTFVGGAYRHFLQAFREKNVSMSIFKIGDSDTPAVNALLWDDKEKVMYIGTKYVVDAWLRWQWQDRPYPKLDLPEGFEIIDQGGRNG